MDFLSVCAWTVSPSTHKLQAGHVRHDVEARFVGIECVCVRPFPSIDARPKARIDPLQAWKVVTVETEMHDSPSFTHRRRLLSDIGLTVAVCAFAEQAAC